MESHCEVKRNCRGLVYVFALMYPLFTWKPFLALGRLKIPCSHWFPWLPSLLNIRCGRRSFSCLKYTFRAPIFVPNMWYLKLFLVVFTAVENSVFLLSRKIEQFFFFFLSKNLRQIQRRESSSNISNFRVYSCLLEMLKCSCHFICWNKRYISSCGVHERCELNLE